MSPALSKTDAFKLEEEIRLACAKHRGNVLAISNELNVPFAYVKRVINRIKTTGRPDVAQIVSQNLMNHIVEGYEQRVSYLEKCLIALENKETVKLSLCCSAIVEEQKKKQKNGKKKIIHICLICGHECEVKNTEKEEVFELKYKAIEMLREEDKALVEFANKMGYTNREELPAINYTQNVAILPDGETPLKPEHIQDLSNLSPMDRAKVRRRLENVILGKKQAETE